MKRTLSIAVLSLSCLPLFGQVVVTAVPVVTRSGTASGFWTRGGSGINAEMFSWNQTAGTEFHNATIFAMMHSTVSGVTAQGLAYLYSAPGLNAPLSSATLVPGNSVTPSFSNPATIATSFTVPSPFVLFTGSTPLAAPGDRTFFIVIVPAAGATGDALAVDFADPLVGGTATTTYSGGGVGVNPDRVTTGAVATPPNATATFANASPNTMLYSVAADIGAPPASPAPTGVPALGSWGAGATVILLGLSGFQLLRREARN